MSQDWTWSSPKLKKSYPWRWLRIFLLLGSQIEDKLQSKFLLRKWVSWEIFKKKQKCEQREQQHFKRIFSSLYFVFFFVFPFKVLRVWCRSDFTNPLCCFQEPYPNKLKIKHLTQWILKVLNHNLFHLPTISLLKFLENWAEAAKHMPAPVSTWLRYHV